MDWIFQKGHYKGGKSQENRHKNMGVDYQIVRGVKWFFEQNIKLGSKNSDF